MIATPSLFGGLGGHECLTLPLDGDVLLDAVHLVLVRATWLSLRTVAHPTFARQWSSRYRGPTNPQRMTAGCPGLPSKTLHSSTHTVSNTNCTPFGFLPQSLVNKLPPSTVCLSTMSLSTRSSTFPYDNGRRITPGLMPSRFPT